MKWNREALVDQLILMEQQYAQLHERWLTANDNVLEWQLRAEQAEAQLNRIRHPQKESQREKQ